MTPNNTLNILFTCAGRKVSLIESFRRALGELGFEGSIVGTDASPLSAALQVCDYRYLVPPVSDPAYIPTLLEICREHEIGLLVPLIDVDLLLLAQHRDAFAAIGTSPLISALSAVQICGDKRSTARFFEEHNIPTIHTLSQEELVAGKAGYPLFIKPARGSGSINSFKVSSAEELAFFLRYISEPMVQTFARGQEYTVDALVALDGRVINAVPRRRIEVRAGEISKGTTVKDWYIIRETVALLEKLDLVGPITVQCFAEGDRVQFTEINPRVGGGLPLTIAAGADYPAQIIRMVSGETVEPCIGDFLDDYYMFRYEEGVYVAGDVIQNVTPRSVV